MPRWSDVERTHLGDGQSSLVVSPLSLQITVDGVGLGVLETGNLEGDTGGSLGSDLEGGSGKGVVSAEEIRRRLSDIL